MPERIFVRPAEGRRVRLPGDGSPIPPEGMEVDRDTFVIRRLADGDLLEVPPQTAGKGSKG
ncbi:DUF2635 domain-containing protein [Roseomonas sp. HJA6]|uniref:DUF2635 domain-containing protein n=1 Tax=Roseomonas alba TaxID=2846776 RepID=A0ABS7AID2_9PROT|nr:DUF2635 domain-containing protein [Neoroseomonas alba]MBW6402081.1 DUF2635 domain-containing protein [Neoroseomonas alba]